MVCLKGQSWVHCSAADVPSSLLLQLVGGDSGPPVTIPASVLIPFAPPDIELQILSLCCPCLSPITIIIPFSTSPTLLMVYQVLCQGKTDNFPKLKTSQKMLEDVEAVLALLCPGIRVNMLCGATAQLSCTQKLEIVVELKEQQQQHAVEELPVEAGEHSEDEEESGEIEWTQRVQDLAKRTEAFQTQLAALGGRRLLLPSRESHKVPVNEKVKTTFEICYKICRNLPRHIKCYHSQIEEKCPMCEKKLRVTNMESHIRNVHDNQAQACPHCGKLLVRLSQHIKKAHSSSKSITETTELSAHAEEEEGPYRNLRKRRNNHSVNLEDYYDEPNGDVLNDENLNVFPQKEGPYRNLRKRKRNSRVDLEVESDY